MRRREHHRDIDLARMMCGRGRRSFRRWSFLPCHFLSIALPSRRSKAEAEALRGAKAMVQTAPADRPILAAVLLLLCAARRSAARRSAARAAGGGGMVFRL